MHWTSLSLRVIIETANQYHCLYFSRETFSPFSLTCTTISAQGFVLQVYYVKDPVDFGAGLRTIKKSFRPPLQKGKMPLSERRVMPSRKKWQKKYA